MPWVNFGRKDQTETRFELQQSNDLIVTRTFDRSSVMGSINAKTSLGMTLADCVRVLSFPPAGVEVFRVPTERRSIEERKITLNGHAMIEFAGRVLVDPILKLPVVYSENLYIRFHEGVRSEDCVRLLRKQKLEVKQAFKFAPNAYFVSAPKDTGQVVFEMAQELLDRNDVLYSHPELLREREYKAISPEQWHLKPIRRGDDGQFVDANVEAAHQKNVTGRGVTIAIIDDAVAIDHREFDSVNSDKVVAPYDVGRKDSNPRPVPWDPSNGPIPPHWEQWHGTACAGVACANGIGASGVAPEARLIPIRLKEPVGSMLESEAFGWAVDHEADVISCSWGPPDGWSSFYPLPAHTRDAINYAVTKGRNGKGCLVFFAAGNGDESVDTDEYASYANVIAVAACNDRGTRASYSDFGRAIWCCFPSGDSHAGSGIWTTDVPGPLGYNPGGSTARGDVDGWYTNQFNGTSSSCPGAAGVAALVLSVNPNLNWIEVRDILALTADKIDTPNGQYDANGHSIYYGYGKLNAAKAVEYAQRTIAPPAIAAARSPSRLPASLSLANVPAGGIARSLSIGSAALNLRLNFAIKGNLRVTFTPPLGSDLPSTIFVQKPAAGCNHVDLKFDETNMQCLAALAGGQGQGEWQISIEEDAGGDYSGDGNPPPSPPPHKPADSAAPDERGSGASTGRNAKLSSAPKRSAKKTPARKSRKVT